MHSIRRFVLASVLCLASFFSFATVVYAAQRVSFGDVLASVAAPISLDVRIPAVVEVAPAEILAPVYALSYRTDGANLRDIVRLD